MPLGDWQFWVVTIVALVALAMIVRPFVRRKSKPRKVDLTIERKKVDR